MGGWFADLVADAGISTRMSHPLPTKAITAVRVRNEASDAKTLAYLLRTSRLPHVWVAPPEARVVDMEVAHETRGEVVWFAVGPTVDLYGYVHYVAKCTSTASVALRT